MPNRIIKESICTSDTLAQLTAEEERLFYRLIVQADDWGRFDGRAQVIRAACFPLQLDDITTDDVESWLNRLADVGLIRFYTVDGRRYLYFVTWDKHQQKRAKHSKWPEPPSDGEHPNSSDITCNQTIAYVPENRESRIENREARNETRAHEGDLGASIDSDSLLSPSEDLQKVVEHYHQVIGLLSPTAFQKLQFWLDEQGMEADVVCAAIDTTREQAERPGIAYLEGVLRNWYNEGVRTMADLRTLERSPTDKKTDKKTGKKTAKLAALFRQKADEMEAARDVKGA